MEEKRSAYKVVDGNEVEISFSDIKRGMYVKLYEPDGEVVKDSSGNTVFRATSDVYTNVDGILTFETKE